MQLRRYMRADCSYARPRRARSRALKRVLPALVLGGVLLAPAARAIDPVPRVALTVSPLVYDTPFWAVLDNVLIDDGYVCGPNGTRLGVAFRWSGACAADHFEGPGELDIVPPGGGNIVLHVDFSGGLLDGPAIFLLKDGAAFDGTYRAGKANGPASFVTPQGTRVEGVLRDNQWAAGFAIVYRDGTTAHYDKAPSDFAFSRFTETLPNGTMLKAMLMPTRDGYAYTHAVVTFGDGAVLRFDGDGDPHAIYRDSHGRRFAGRFVAARPDTVAWHPPYYPPLSRRLSERGTVSLSFVIGVDGQVSDVRLREPTGFLRLDEAALKGAAAWRYLPATVGGRPIATVATATVTFDAPEPEMTIQNVPLAVTAR